MKSSPHPPETNEAVVTAYDRLAILYDRVIAPLESGTRNRAIEALSIEAGDRIVEVGCGPGHALASLAGHVGRSGQVVGLDAAPGMIRRARERTTSHGVGDRASLALGDARSLPFRDDVADVVFVEDTLELFSPVDASVVLEEIHRILAPDGQLAVVTMERDDTEDDRFIRAYEWAFDHVPGFARVGCRPIYARRTIESAGFTVERQDRYRRGHVWPVEILFARPE